jgi:hypothetical protein
MSVITKNLAAYAEIVEAGKPPITNNFRLAPKAMSRRNRRAVRTLQVKAALKKLFPMEMHLIEKRRIG